MVIGLTSGKSFACAGRAMEQDCKTTPFTAYYIAEARFIQPIRFDHSLDDPLVIIPNDQSFERPLSKSDRLEVIYLH